MPSILFRCPWARPSTLFLLAAFLLGGLAETVHAQTVLDDIPPGSVPPLHTAPNPPTIDPAVSDWKYGLHDPCYGVRTWGAVPSPFDASTALRTRMEGCAGTCGTFNIYKDFVFGSPLDRQSAQVQFDAEFDKLGVDSHNRAHIQFQFSRAGSAVGQINVGYDTLGTVYNVPPGGFASGTWQFGMESLADDPDTMRVLIHTRSCVGGNGQVTLDNIHLLSSDDTTAPVLLLPNDVGEEATSASGADVSYIASASDDVDGVVPVTCAPESGSLFPLGATIVECTASDSSGNSSTATFTVTVKDTTAPSLVVPADITQVATSPLGDAITFAATATDAVDPSPVVTCAPASGSTFALGTTTVECVAEDASGNVSAPSSFDVTLTFGDETFDGLAAKIQAMGLENGLENALIAKVSAAKKSFGKGGINAALWSLNALLNQISAQTGKKLSLAQAAELTGCVDALIAALS